MIGGQDLAALSPAARDRFRGRHVGIVPQRLHLVDCLTVLDNLLLARYLAGLPAAAQDARQTLAALGLSDKARTRLPSLTARPNGLPSRVPS